MPTGGKTEPIHVYEGLAAYLKAQKENGAGSIWKIVELGLKPDFIKKYNAWVREDPTAQKANYKEIDTNDW